MNLNELDLIFTAFIFIFCSFPARLFKFTEILKPALYYKGFLILSYTL